MIAKELSIVFVDASYQEIRRIRYLREWVKGDFRTLTLCYLSLA